MRDEDLLAALRRLKVQTGSLACVGCGHEHNCGIRGCHILRETVAWLERKLAEDKDGRVVVLPCKVGDTVCGRVRDHWEVLYGHRISHGRPHEGTVRSPGWRIWQDGFPDQRGSGESIGGDEGWLI